MVLAEVRESLRQRLKRPTYWWAVSSFYSVYVLAFLPPGGLRGLDLGVLLDTFLSPLLLFSTFAWVSPMPWQWDGHHLNRPPLRRGLPQAVLFLGTLVFLEICLSSLYYRIGHQSFPWKAFLTQNLLFSCPLMIIFGGVVAHREADQREKDEARIESRVAQTRLLQSQLHPHVLFNALNGLAELIHKDPPRAEHAVRSLSDLLRRLLLVSEVTEIPLGEERRIVEDYLALESMRLGDRLKIEWAWQEDVDPRAVIPLLLQPLVENAIKHGIAPHEAGGTLVISAAMEEGSLRLEVRNSGMSLAPRIRGTGIGIKNLRARLALAYGSQAELRILEDGGWVSARIAIKMDWSGASNGRLESRHR